MVRGIAVPNHSRNIRRRISSMSIFICHHGCGRIAVFQNKSGNWLCDTSSSRCPEIKRKNSLKTKEAYSSGRRIDQKAQYKSLSEESKSKMSWSKGLTKETDGRIEKQASKIRGKRKITDKEKIAYIEYREKCAFNLSGYEISKIKGYELLKDLGMYHKIKNTSGVVRDHRISIWHGWLNKIDPSIISHPANCEFITHKANASKSILISVELNELKLEIENWDCEGNRYTLLVENQ